jgi:hypothetical protein
VKSLPWGYQELQDYNYIINNPFTSVISTSTILHYVKCFYIISKIRTVAMLVITICRCTIIYLHKNLHILASVYPWLTPTNKQTNKQTNFMRQSPIWEADFHADSQEISSLLRKPSIHNRLHCFKKYIRGCIQKFPDWVVTKWKTITINTRWKATQKFMAATLNRLTHKIAIQLHLVAESCTICSSRSSRPVRKLLDTHSYLSKFY